MKKETLNLKSLKIIEDDSIRLREIQNCYICDISKYWNDPKEKKYYDKYVVLQTHDNYFILVQRKDLDGIDKTLWYDDEQEAPNNTYKNFEFYNMRHLSIRFNKTQDIYIGKKDNYCTYVSPRDLTEYSGWFTKIRELEKNELDDLETVVNYYNNRAIERLQKYWKRYSDKVFWCGYWVNR